MRDLFAIICIAVALLVSGCRAIKNGDSHLQNNGDQGNQNTANNSPTPPKKMISGDLSEGKALKLVYGNYGIYKEYDDKKKCAKWKLTKDEMEKFGFSDQDFSQSKERIVYTSSVMTKSYVETGHERFILVTQTVPAQYGCHACSPAMGGATFTRIADGWQLDSETKFTTRTGSNGEIPKGAVIKVGPDKNGVLFKLGDMHQGVGNEYMVLVAEVDDHIAELLSIGLGEDNGGGGSDAGTDGSQSDCGPFGTDPCYSYTSKIEFVPGDNPDYFDLRIKTAGTELNKKDRLIKVNQLKTYVFSDSKYVLQK
jgi:hypothetical protein